jgi:hypothetical protein
MTEIILDQHGNEAPNTYTDGSVPIDGIFASKGISAMFSGYSSFCWGMYSDHRLLWADLDMSALLGTTAAPLWKPQARRLKCEDPRLVTRFVNKRLQHMVEADLEGKRLHITELIENNANIQEWGPILEELDQLRVEGIMQADNQCRKLCMGNVPWSPDLQLCMSRIGYYQRCRLRYCLHKQINSRTLRHWFKKAKLDIPVTSANMVIKCIQEEFRTYNIIKNQATSKRKIFLETLAEAKANEEDLSTENILKQMIQREELPAVFRKIKSVLGKFRQRVQAIETKNIDGEWELKQRRHRARLYS